MKHTFLLALCILLPELALSQFYFPLQSGNWWNFMDCGGLAGCDDVFFTARVIKDSVIAGKKYSMTQGLFPSRFLRQEANRVFAYDTTEPSEFLLLDFSAKAGDTISVRANHTKFIIAGQNYWFTEYDTTKAYSFQSRGWAIRDSFGVTDQSSYPCYFCSRRAFIDGKSIVLGVADHSANPAIPATAILEQNFPNPFNPTTLIRFALPSEQMVTIEVFNSLGESVTVLLSKRSSAGWHSFSWNASHLPSGPYYCPLTTNQTVLTTTMVLLK